MAICAPREDSRDRNVSSNRSTQFPILSLGRRRRYGLRRLASSALGAICFASLTLFSSAMSQEYVLEYSLEAVGVPSPETAKIRFTLTNSGKDSLRILPW